MYIRCEEEENGVIVYMGADDSDKVKFDHLYAFIWKYLNKPVPGPGSVEYIPATDNQLPPSIDDFFNDHFFENISSSGSGG
jgi:hypothetical protein